MKIKIWALVLIIVGALVIGAAGGFAATGGFALAGKLMQNIVSIRADNAPRVDVHLPGRMQPGQGGQGRQGQQGQDSALPPGFNAGVSIPAVYGGMTNRTEEQVLTAAKQANTDTWGLAKTENKLDALKQQVLTAVTSSLDKMITDGKITQAQKDSYLSWVNQLLQYVGNANTSPGDWRGQRGGINGSGQNGPDASSSATN